MIYLLQVPILPTIELDAGRCAIAAGIMVLVILLIVRAALKDKGR